MTPTVIARVLALAPKLAATMGDMPLDFASGWIARESGGFNDRPSSIGELGIFQIGVDTAKDNGIDLARVGTDLDYSLASTLKLIEKWRSNVAKSGVAETNSEAYWALVKMWHTLPLLAKNIQDAAKAAGLVGVSDWATLRDLAVARVPESVAGHDRDKWLDNVDGVLANAETFAPMLTATGFGGSLLESAVPTTLILVAAAVGLAWLASRG